MDIIYILLLASYLNLHFISLFIGKGIIECSVSLMLLIHAF